MFPRLPVISGLERLVSPNLGKVLQRTLIVACQHLLETTGSLFEALTRSGAHQDRIFVIGKCYSTNQRVVEHLRSLGIDVSPGLVPGSPGHHWASVEDDVSKLWKRVLSTPDGEYD